MAKSILNSFFFFFFFLKTKVHSVYICIHRLSKNKKNKKNKKDLVKKQFLEFGLAPYQTSGKGISKYWKRYKS